MNQPDPDENTPPRQASESLETCMSIARQSLLRHHSADYIEKNPAIFAACIQACAIDRATRDITNRLDDLLELLKGRD